jgi:TRAP-type C4-dicarboxylate transport system permease small subunit
MLSLSKLLVLVAAVAVVWFGFRWWQRHQIAARAPAPRARSRGADAGRPCPRCGIYVTASAGPCERADCPRRA